MRQDWAAGWARHLQPGAKLVCLAFPIDPERQTGPPWPVDVATYKQLLLPHGEGGLLGSGTRVGQGCCCRMLPCSGGCSVSVRVEA